VTLAAVGTFASHPGPVTALFLHGWGSDERDLASLSSYLPAGMPWASVRAPLRHPAFGYAWYPLDSEDSWDAVEPIEVATEALWSWIDSALATEARVLPIGFSQGGLMASQLLRTRPERVAATVILSGYVRSGEERADAVLAQSLPRVFWARGGADPVIPQRALMQTEEFLAAHATPEIRVYPGLGHSVSERELEHLQVFLERALSGD
jgi:phospholipase/carboxylesterase